ncbi:unnamed protein product, partial [Ixodes pacificus]
GIREVSKRDENVLAQTLELLDELLKKKSQGQKLKKGQDQMGNSQEGVDEVEQASIMAHQEALRKATHLRQRKISTELKVETLQKQLRKPSKKSQPKAIPELPEGREIVEEQLVELTEKLRRLEGNLGQTEREALKVRREWDKRMEEVYQHLFDDKQLLPEAFREPWTQDGTPRILVSKTQDSGRSGGSLRVRAAKLIPSSKAKKKDNDGHNGSMKKSASNNSRTSFPLLLAQYTRRETKKEEETRARDDVRTSSCARRLPITAINSMVPANSGYNGKLYMRTESSMHESVVKSSTSSFTRGKKKSSSVLHARFFSLRRSQLRQSLSSSLPVAPGTKNASAAHHVTFFTRIQSTVNWRLYLPGSRVSVVNFFIDQSMLQAPEEVPPASLDSGGDSYGSEDAHSLDSGGALVVDPVEAPLRYEVDPDILAEIEASGAFEQMAQDYLKRHGQDFPF